MMNVGRRVGLGWALVVGAAACASPPTKAPPPPPEAPADIVIAVVASADIHGQVGPQRVTDSEGRDLEVGGLAAFGGYLRNLRGALGGRVLLLDGGDIYQGTLVSNRSEGRVMIEAMGALGYHGAAVGNHEFDWGVGLFRARAKEARFPFLAANILDEATGRAPGWANVKPWTMVELGGVRIGVIGLTTLDTPVFQRSGTFEGVRFESLEETVRAWAPRVRAAGAEVVVVTAHEGGVCHRFDDPRDLAGCKRGSDIFRLAEALEPGSVDLIVGGHTHHRIAHFVAGIPIIQAGAKGAAFARADLVVGGKTRRVLTERTVIHPPTEICLRVHGASGRCNSRGRGPLQEARYEGAPVQVDESVAAVLKPYEDEVRALRAKPIGAEAATPLTRNHDGESELGNLIADSLRAAVLGAHIGLQNSGGIRADIDAGPITFGELFDVLPFGNKVAAMRLTGAQLRELILMGLHGKHGAVQISGLRVVVDLSKIGCPGGAALVEATLSDGAAIREGAEYVLVTNDYLAKGGSGYDSLVSRLPEGAVTVHDTVLREALEQHVRRIGHPIDSAEHPLIDKARPRIEFRNTRARRECDGA
jgi:5'-nucleotidase